MYLGDKRAVLTASSRSVCFERRCVICYFVRKESYIDACLVGHSTSLQLIQQTSVTYLLINQLSVDFMVAASAVTLQAISTIT